MKSDLQFCPGNSLSSFLRIISYDLKWRQIEHLILAYFNDKEFPVAMRQITGRTSWVAYSINDIITEAKGLNASGICLVHNHPASADEKPSLKPSQEDISFQQQFLGACQANNLSYLGSWISSKGQLTEILYHAWQEAIRTQYTYAEDELLKVTYALTPTFTETVQSLIKPVITVVDEYNIGKINVLPDKLYPQPGDVGILSISTIAAYPFGNVPPSCGYQLKLLIFDVDHNILTETLSFEEAMRACYALVDLFEESRRLSGQNIENKKVVLALTDNSTCGFFKQELKQTAFISIKGQSYILEDVDKLQQLHNLFEKSLKHIESFVIG